MRTHTRFKTALMIGLLLLLVAGGITLTVLGLQETRMVGAVSIAADEFTDIGGGLTRARGNIRLGQHFYLTGPSDVVIFNATTLSGDGSLAFGQGGAQVPLFTGAFSVPASAGVLLRNPGSSYDLRVAGFAVDPAGTNLIINLPAGRVSGASALRITPPGVDTATTVDFTLTADALGRPVFEGLASLLNFTVSGVQLSAAGATLSNAGLTAATAELRLPDKLGGLSIAIQSLRITPNELGMNGGLAFTLPDMLFGDGSKLKIINNHGVLLYEPEYAGYRLHINGALEINLPENAQTVLIEVTLGEENGEPVLSGSLDQLSLTVAQTNLQLERILINMDGLFIETATLTLPPQLGSGRVFVYNVSLTDAGLQIGAAGAQFPIPDMLIGDGQEVALRNGLATLVVMAGEYRFDIGATLEVQLPEQNHFTADVTLSLANGQVSGRVQNLALTVAGATLTMTDAALSNAGLWVEQATLTMPDLLGGASAYVADVSITNAGLTFGAAGAEFGLPDIVFIQPELLAAGRPPGLAAPALPAAADAPLAITGIRARLEILENATGFRFAANGTLQIHLPDNVQSRALSFAMRYDQIEGFALEGALSGLTLTVAGARLQLGAMQLDLHGLSIANAALTLPETLGGAAIQVTDVRITGAGLSISGGTFDLPLLKLAEGKILITAHAELLVHNGQYRIDANGALTLLLPENTQTIAVAFALDSAGHIQGSVSALRLNIAGVTLDLVEITLNDAGLTTAQAKLLMPNLLGGAEASVTQVRITRNGLDFGAANASVTLPDITFTQGFALNQNVAQLQIVNTPGVTPTTKYQFSVQSQLLLTLPDNPAQQQSLAFTMVYSQGVGYALAGTVSGFDLAVAGAQLQLRAIRLTGDGLRVAQSTLTMPESLGGNTLTLTEVSITRAGLALGAAELTLPDIDFTRAAQLAAAKGRAPGLAAQTPGAPPQAAEIALRLYNNRATFGVYEGHYRFSVSGRYFMGLPGGTVEGAVEFSLAATGDSDYRLAGVLPSLKLTNLAGATLDITNLALNNDGFFVASAQLTLPGGLGNTTVTVSDLSITAAGLRIGNGTFALPDIVFPGGDGSQIKIAQATATMRIADNKYVLTCSGTLQLRLPDNSLDAALSFTLADGVLTGALNQLQLTVAGMTLDLNGAQLNNTGLSITMARLSLPARFGSGVVTLSDVAITRDGLRIGAGAFALPELKIGDGSKVAIRNITASLAVMGPHYTLAAGGTLHLNLPDNAQAIALSFTLDSDGNLHGTIDRLSLTLAGGTLAMQQLTLTNAGLSVAVATLQLPASLGGALATVTQIEITGAGLSIGSGALTLNDIQFGNSAFLRIAQPTATLLIAPEGYGFEVRGRLIVNVPQTNLAVDVRVVVGTDGQFHGQLEQAQLKIATLELLLRDIAITANGLSVPTATLKFPANLGGGAGTIYNVQIDSENGLQIGGGAASFPIPDFKLGGTVGFSVTQATATLQLAADFTYQVSLAGTVSVFIPGTSASVNGMIGINSQGALSGRLDGFNLTVAGLSLQLQDVRVTGYELQIATAALRIPQEWGGASAAVYNVTIRTDGRGLRIGGGEFTLPTIQAGGFTLAARGGLIPQGNGGYTIRGQGVFGVPGLTSAGGCAIGAGFELAVNTAGALVLELTPPVDATPPHPKTLAAAVPLATPSGVQLRQVYLGMYGCSLPIGATGFNLTRVQGQITLDAGSTQVSVGVTVGTAFALPIVGPALSGDLDMTFKTNPIAFELAGLLKVFVYQAAGARATLNAQDGFRSTLWIDAVFAKGAFTLHAWNATLWDGTKKFSFNGSGTVEVGIPKGKIWAWPAFPTQDWVGPNIGVEFGEFSNGRKTVYGVKGWVDVNGYWASFFIDENASLDVLNSDSYYQVTAAQLRHYLASPALMAAHGVTRLANDDVLISIPVTGTADLIFMVARTGAAPMLSLITPDNLEVAPDSLPANVIYQQTAYITATQQTYIVNTAQAGLWHARLSGAPGPGDEYQLAVLGNAPPPALSAVSVGATGATAAKAQWRLRAPLPETVVSIYLTTGPITYTAVITQTGGTTSTVTLPLYTGNRVAEALPSAVDGTLQTVALDLRGQPSGVYWLWLEADDGRNPPTRAYASTPLTVQQPPPTGPWDAGIVYTATYRQMEVAWQPHSSPDVDGYVVYLGDAPGKLTSLAVTRGLTVETATSALLAGLEPGRTYYVTVQAYDRQVGWRLTSNPVVAAAPAAAFTLQLPGPITVTGGMEQTFIVTLTTALTPYPDVVQLRAGTLPDGLELHFPQGVVTPTVAGVAVQGVLSATDSLAEQVYAVPLLAQGGGMTRQGALAALVLEPRFALMGAPAAVQLQPGDARAIVIAAERIHNERDPVNLRFANPPAGLLWTLDRVTLLPGQSATLRITDTTLLAHGVYALALSGADGQHTEPLTLTLRVEKSDFAAQVGAPATPILAGAETALPIALTATGDWAAPVTVTLDPQTLPATFAYLLTQATVMPPAQVQLLLRPARNTPVGVYRLRLNASGGGKLHSVEFSVEVVAPPPVGVVYLPLVLRQK